MCGCVFFLCVDRLHCNTSVWRKYSVGVSCRIGNSNDAEAGTKLLRMSGEHARARRLWLTSASHKGWRWGWLGKDMDKKTADVTSSTGLHQPLTADWDRLEEDTSSRERLDAVGWMLGAAESSAADCFKPAISSGSRTWQCGGRRHGGAGAGGRGWGTQFHVTCARPCVSSR